MNEKYQVHVGGRPQAIFEDLDDAKAAGRAYAQKSASVHIEIFPPKTLLPTPMRALRFDSDIQDWVDTSLPVNPS